MKFAALFVVMGLPFSAIASDVVKYNAAGQAKVIHTKLSINPERSMVLRGRISDASVSPLLSAFNTMLAANNSPVFIVLDSPGGSVASGMLLVNMIQAAKAEKGVKTVCVIQNEAFSMAAIIQSFCNQTFIIAGSGLMYHEAAFQVQGQISSVKSYVSFVDATLDELNAKIATQLGMTKEQYIARISREWWLTSEQAAQFGLVDGIIEYALYPEPEVDINPFEDILKKIPLTAPLPDERKVR